MITYWLENVDLVEGLSCTDYAIDRQAQSRRARRLSRDMAQDGTERKQRSQDEEQEATSKSGVRIVDRRRFDSDGEEKSDAAAAQANREKEVARERESARERQNSAQAAQQREVPSQPREAPGYTPSPQSSSVEDENDDQEFTMKEAPPEGQEEGSEISFGSFVLSLATQALVQLGQIRPPEGMSLPVDPIAAKQTIDILSMLEQKTKNNLDAQEARLLNDALHNLRLAYLRFR